MTSADAEEYTQALGQVVAGGWRQIALGERLGVPKALKLTTERWVKERLGGYVKYSVAERRDTVKAMAGEGHSERAISRVLGVHRDAVRKQLGKPGTKRTRAAETHEQRASDAGTKRTTAPLDVITGLAVDRPRLDEAARSTMRETRRANREAVHGDARQAPDLPAMKFRVLYADPPWSYSDKADGPSVQSGGAEQHYPSMTIPELCALDVPAICEDDAVLFLWTTSPLLEESFEVIRAWGFTYKSSFVWDKHAHNRGHYNSVRHEFLLVAVRGSCRPDVPKLFDSVQKAGRTDHSEKPGIFRVIIETLYPHGPRVELFARGEPAGGWEAWGNETIDGVAS